MCIYVINKILIYFYTIPKMFFENGPLNPGHTKHISQLSVLTTDLFRQILGERGGENLYREEGFKTGLRYYFQTNQGIYSITTPPLPGEPWTPLRQFPGDTSPGFPGRVQGSPVGSSALSFFAPFRKIIPRRECIYSISYHSSSLRITAADPQKIVIQMPATPVQGSPVKSRVPRVQGSPGGGYGAAGR